VNHWEEWLPGPRTATGRGYARLRWSGKAQHHLRQIARIFRLPTSLLLQVPPVPAKAAHARRFGR
jgi:hypothetical protein